MLPITAWRGARLGACLVPATKRADVNGVVRRRLGVRKASYLAQADAVERLLARLPGAKVVDDLGRTS